METNNINIANLLKGCPIGTELYSSICGDCRLNCSVEKLVEHNIMPIVIVSRNQYEYALLPSGKREENGECLLFPSNEIRDWNLFQVQYIKMTGVKENDDKLKELLDIDHPVLNRKEYLPDTILYRGRLDNEVYSNRANDEEYNFILSTGTELKLEEKEEPKFNVGDVVKGTGIMCCYLKDERCARNAELSDKRLATPEEIAKWNEEVLQPNHLHYSTGKRKIIDWFLPFDKVVVRIAEDCTWKANIFSHIQYKKGEYPYVCVYGAYGECLSYNEKTAKLIGTTDDYKEE